MGYAPVNRSAHGVPEENWSDNIQMQAYSSQPVPLYSPPDGPPPDAKVKSYADSQHSRKSLIRHWPVESQRIWTMTPFRAFVMFLDVILASAPIMFLGIISTITSEACLLTLRSSTCFDRSATRRKRSFNIRTTSPPRTTPLANIVPGNIRSTDGAMF